VSSAANGVVERGNHTIIEGHEHNCLTLGYLTPSGQNQLLPIVIFTALSHPISILIKYLYKNG
jgi:hypothetical protein